MSDGLHHRIDGEGRPLIIQPPAWGPSSDYLRLTLAPLLTGVRVVTYDARNTGRSPRHRAADAQAVDHLVADLEELRAGLGIERFVLLGHSHGGFIAMAYAARHAEHLEALVLCNTTVRRSIGADETESILARMASDPARRDAVELFRATRGRLRGAADDRELARQMRRLMPVYFHDLEAMRRFGLAARQAVPPSAAALARVPEELDAWVEGAIEDLAVPALVLTGRYDVATPPAASRHIADLIGGARLEIFERSGHHPWIEEPERFREIVREFLAGLPPPGGGGGGAV